MKPRLIILTFLVLLVYPQQTAGGIRLSYGKWTSMYIKPVGAPQGVAKPVQSERYKREATVNPDIQSLAITSKTISRYVTVEIVSSILNPDSKDRQVTFQVQLPTTAFISNFTMLIADELFIAQIKSKEEARKLYDEARQKNETAGIVENDEINDNISEKPENNMEKFTVSINVGAGETADFTLTYQELLQRRKSLYEQIISVRPNQPVPELSISAYVYEPQGISSITYDEPGPSNTIASLTSRSDQYKEIVYRPTLAQQESMNSEKGIDDDFVISYDVNHQNDAGMVQIDSSQDYFVHYFSPADDNYQSLPKNVIFVIDISGSMSGTKMEQTRSAMQTILQQLNSDDKFMLILFDDELEYWPSNQNLVSASQDNIQAARAYCNDKLVAGGYTNIYSSLIAATDILKRVGRKGSNIVVFLTDGEPSAGVTDSGRIIRGVSENAAGKVSVFSLAFGEYADMNLLSAISARTKGTAQLIYEGQDAGSQLENFFDEVNFILIYDIQIEYPETAVVIDSLTQISYDQYFKGSEIVVSGKLNSNVPDVWDLGVSGFTTVAFEMSKTVNTNSDVVEIPDQAMDEYDGQFIEKLYVYMKIKDILREMLLQDDEQKKDALENQALQLALDYNLVTPLTSLVIVQNNMLQEDMGIKAFGKSAVHASHSAMTFGIACIIYLFNM